MKNIKVSVIVPCYNVEKYLAKCLKSLKSQTLKEMEIILIDDGSQDNTPKICDEFCTQDKRFKVIHKKNEGVGITNNLGISIAKGEYIGFVESDDWIEPDMYAFLYKKAKKYHADVVKSGYFKSFENIEEKVNYFESSPFINKVGTNIQIPEFLLGGHISHWSGIYKKEFIQKNKIRFNTSPGAQFQDTGFSAQIYAYMKSCYLTSQCFYHYRQDNPNASIHQKYKAAIYAYNEQKFILDRLKKMTQDPLILEIFTKFAFVSLIGNYRRRCTPFEQIQYSYFMSEIFKKHLKIRKKCFTLFTPKEKKVFLHIARYSFLYGLKDFLYSTKK